jgi:hypothetical protein
MYRISAALKIHAALHFAKKSEGTKYILQKKLTFFFLLVRTVFKENSKFNLFLFF